jgi:ClpP class serine protease
MSVYLPFMMEHLFNTPVALHPAKAEMICAALSGRLNITSLENASTKLDARALEDLASMGRRSVAFTNERVLELEAKRPDGGAQAQVREVDERPYDVAGRIAIIRVWGTLTRNWGVGPYSGSTGYDGILTQILYAQNDRAVDKIWMDVNSGGGAVNGLFDLQQAIWSMNGAHGGKPIYAMAADYAYSAAYAIAVAADKVFVPRTGGVGSVGTVALHADLSKALEEEGIKVTVIRAPKRKFRGNPYEALDEETLAHLQEQIDDTTDLFQDRVAECMGIAKSVVSETEGLDYMGRKAKAIGFVNEVLSEQEAWAKLEEL